MAIRATHRLNASTLTEVIVSLALISVMFVIAAWVWLQVNSNRSPERLVLARMKAREMLEENAPISDKSEKWSGFSFSRMIQPLPGKKGLLEVKVVVTGPDDDVVMQRSRIIPYQP